MADFGKETRKSNGFISGVLILSLSAVIVKIIGLIYKIPMLRLLGSEGMGYFNSAYEIYTLFLTVATTGLPVAMSVMISSGEGGSAKRVFSVAIRIFLILGAVGSLVMLIFARPFALYLGEEGARSCIVAIAPTVLLICVLSAYRGYFQGLGKMLPTGVSQMIEALCKLVLGLLFAHIALNFGSDTEKTAAAAVLGITFGTAISLIYLVLSKLFSKPDGSVRSDKRSGRHVAAELMRTAIPVTLSSAVISLSKVIDMTMILRRLQSMGKSASEAFAAYGNYTTLALPLFGVAPALVGAVAMPLIPALSRAVADGDRDEQKKVISDALRITAIIAMPISAGLTMFSEPILSLLFGGETEAINASAPLLTVLGLSVTLSCLITVGNAILQAYKSPAIPILSMAIGSVVKIALAYILIGIEPIGLMGAPISTLVCDLVINTVNFAFVGRKTPDMPHVFDVMLKPFLAACVSVAVARVAYNLSLPRFAMPRLVSIGAILLSALLYLLLALAFGAVKKSDITQRLIKDA